MTLQEKAVSRKYAQAFLRVFGNKITTDDVRALEYSSVFFQENSDKFFYLYLSSISSEIKRDLMMQVCSPFGLKTILQPLVGILAQHGRLTLLGTVLQQIIVVYKEQHDIIDARFISVHPLQADEQIVMKKFFEHITGKTVQAQLVIDPRLIAGVRLQGDTVVWEHSVAKQLRSICSSV